MLRELATGAPHSVRGGMSCPHNPQDGKRCQMTLNLLDPPPTEALPQVQAGAHSEYCATEPHQVVLADPPIERRARQPCFANIKGKRCEHAQALSTRLDFGEIDTICGPPPVLSSERLKFTKSCWSVPLVQYNRATSYSSYL